LRVLSTIVFGTALVAAACGREGAGPGNTLKVGVIAPLSGSLAPFGQGIRKSAELAVELANAKTGVKFELVAADDGADPVKGADAARNLAEEPNLVAVIGTYNSGVAEKIQPILDRAGIPMISPGNTLPSLTLGPDWRTNPQRPYSSYFRVVATDREQGRFGAGYAYDTLKRRRAVVIYERKAVSKGLGLVYSEAFRRRGGTVVEEIELKSEADIKGAVAKAKSDAPDIIFFGGEYPVGGIVAKEMFAAGLKAPGVVLMGGDGLIDNAFVKIAGPGAAQGHYASLVGATVNLLPGSKPFVDAYRTKYGTSDWNAFGPPAFDATNIAIQALRNALGENVTLTAAMRRHLIEAIQNITYRGVLGTTTFDPFGDTVNRIVTINRVEGGGFKPLGTLTGP
jgi:branched-chain amino acid transport system substrate-binding protein